VRRSDWKRQVASACPEGVQGGNTLFDTRLIPRLDGYITADDDIGKRRDASDYPRKKALARRDASD